MPGDTLTLIACIAAAQKLGISSAAVYASVFDQHRRAALMIGWSTNINARRRMHYS
jgi:hypothetical protein